MPQVRAPPLHLLSLVGEGPPVGMAGDNDDQVLLGYLMARHYSKLRGARGGTPKPAPARPTMPKRRWRLLALTCLVSGVVMGVAIAGALGWPLTRGARREEWSCSWAGRC